MSFTLVVTCDKISEVDFKNYEGVVTLEKVSAVDIDGYNIETLVELIGKDRVLDAIGKQDALDHFGIEEKED